MDPLKFKDSRKYPERLKEAMEATGETDALVVMGGTLKGLPVVACAFEFGFLGGSMGPEPQLAALHDKGVPLSGLADGLEALLVERFGARRRHPAA